MAEQARVMPLHGSGEERMRDAIAQGLVAPELQKDMEALRAENIALKRKLSDMTAERDQYRAIVRNERRVRIAAYRERIERRDAWREGSEQRAAIRALTLLGGMIALGVLSMAIGWWSV